VPNGRSGQLLEPLLLLVGGALEVLHHHAPARTLLLAPLASPFARESPALAPGREAHAPTGESFAQTGLHQERERDQEERGEEHEGPGQVHARLEETG